jgi:hypothetical protein
VVNTTPPVFTYVTNKTVQCATNWTFDQPTVYDPCCSNVTVQLISSNQVSGPCPAVWQGIWQATDCCSNISTCTQTVTVVDTTAPVITCASNKTVQCGTNWTFDRPSAHDACCTNVDIQLISSNQISGPCPAVWQGIWQAMDCCSNISTCTQTVTVVDTTPPVINCPSNIVVNSCTNVVVSYSNLVTVTDNCCSNVTVTFNPPSGTVFAPGTTNTVYCTAADCCTNTATNTFTVMVLKRQTIFGLFNTGVDDSGALLGGGQTDGHYKLIVNPSGTDGARVVDSTYILGAWLANNATSQWIGPQTNSTGVENTSYKYRLTFELHCTNNVLITGRWAADNAGAIWLNNSPIVGSGGALSDNNYSNWTNWNAFTITSGFVVGFNTLDFWVTNYATYTGLRVELSGTSDCCCSNWQTFSGMKFSDTNDDGLMQTNEHGLAGWTIKVYDEATNFVTAIQTDASGHYQFSLTCGTYIIREVPQAGWRQTCPSNGYYVVTNGISQSTNLNFGNYFVPLGPVIYPWWNSSQSLTLSWPTSSVDWFLQGTTNLITGPWIAPTNWQVNICNAWNNVVIPIVPTNNMFFRLASTNLGVGP